MKADTPIMHNNPMYLSKNKEAAHSTEAAMPLTFNAADGRTVFTPATIVHISLHTPKTITPPVTYSTAVALASVRDRPYSVAILVLTP